jgi:endoglucanase
MRAIIISICFLFFTRSTVFSQGFLQARNGYIANNTSSNFILRGMGLGGWMLQEPYMLQMGGIAENQQQIHSRIQKLIGPEATKKFYAAWLANHCTRADVDSMAAWGFNSIRLPMHYNLFTLPVEDEPIAGKQTWLPVGFRMVDSLLNWCKANKIYLILDLHAAPGGQGNDVAISDRDKTKPSLWQSRANQEKTIALWKQLATRYAKEEWIGGYDLINETNWGFQDSTDKNGCSEKLNKELKSLLTEITVAVRSVDKNHLIFIEANCWANNYNGMFPLWDPNMAVSFHKYWNHNNTGAIAQFLKIREEQKVPLWMGESGENSNSWFTDAISLLEGQSIGWAWWPLKKLGSNNPLQIKSADGYNKLLEYWRGKAPEPDKATATRTLMELTKALAVPSNQYRHDVIDAMFRQVKSAGAVPFTPNVLKNEALIYATDYDLGRSGVAYHDNDSANYWVSDKKHVSWNQGGQYRNDGVDIEACKDSTTNGYSIGWMETGEWLQYTVTVAEKGWYNSYARMINLSGSAKLQLMVNEKVATEAEGSMAVQTTNWKTIATGKLWLEKGVNQIRVYVAQGGANLNYIILKKTAQQSSIPAAPGHP